MSVPECQEEYIMDSAEFNSILYHAFSIIDLPVNLFVIYLIIYKSSMKMRNIKWTLLNLQIWSTLSDVMLGTFVVPYVAFPVIGYSPTGILVPLGVDPFVQAFIAITMIAEVGASVIIMFENRHRHLSRRNHLGTGTGRKYRRYWLFLNLVAPFPLELLLILGIPDQTNIKDYVLENIECPTQDLVSLPIVVASKTPAFAAILLTIILTFYLVQLVFFMCSSIYYLHNNIQESSASIRTRKLEKKFYYSVCAQSLIPFVNIVIPASICTLTMYYSYYNQSLNNWCVFIISTHGLTGSIAVLLAYKEYRAVLMKIMFKRKISTNNNQSASWVKNDTVFRSNVIL